MSLHFYSIGKGIIVSLFTFWLIGTSLWVGYCMLDSLFHICLWIIASWFISTVIALFVVFLTIERSSVCLDQIAISNSAGAH